MIQFKKNPIKINLQNMGLHIQQDQPHHQKKKYIYSYKERENPSKNERNPDQDEPMID